MRGQMLVAVMLSLSLGLAARGESETKPSAPADSPKEALKAQDAAAKSGSVEADLAFYRAEGDALQKLAQVMAEGDVAVARLQKAVDKRFGKELAAAVATAAGTEDVRSLDGATEKLEGDHATVQFRGQATAVPMVRTEGKWQISLADWVKDAKPEQIDALVRSIQKLTSEVRHVCDLVEHDKFRSGEGVRDRIQSLHDQIFKGG